MDPAYGDVIANKIYLTCFKNLYGKTVKPHTEKEDGKLEQCLNSYVESYKTVTTSFVTYLGKLPKKGLTLE